MANICQKQAQKSWAHFKKCVAKWSGLGIALRVWQDLPIKRLCLFKEKQKLYRENLAKQAEFEAMPFAKVLQGWGVHTEAERQTLLRQKKFEIWLGALLVILGFSGFALHFGNTAWLDLLSCFVGLSVCLLGVVLGFTAYWRKECIDKERFITFIKWLKNFGKM